MRAGFTLVEVLLVVALLVALSAISIPIMASLAEASAFRSASDQLRASGLFARAEADRSGRAVELRLERRGDAWVLVSTGLAATPAGPRASSADAEGDNAGAVVVTDPAMAGVGGDVLLELPARWTVASRERTGVSQGIGAADLAEETEEPTTLGPTMADEGAGLDVGADVGGEEEAGSDPDWDLQVLGSSGAGVSALGGLRGDEGEDAGGREGSGAVLLAVYWPGGTVVVGPREVRIGDGRGRRASVRVNSWSGELVVEEIAAVRPERGESRRAREEGEGAEDVEPERRPETRPEGGASGGSDDGSRVPPEEGAARGEEDRGEVEKAGEEKDKDRGETP